MNKTIANKDKVDAEIISTYASIDIDHVIEEHVLYKGIECLNANHEIAIGSLIETALVEYGLKNNSTNKLYVDYYLTRAAKRSGEYVICNGKSHIHIPMDTYDLLAKKDYEFRNPNRKQSL